MSRHPSSPSIRRAFHSIPSLPFPPNTTLASPALANSSSYVVRPKKRQEWRAKIPLRSHTFQSCFQMSGTQTPRGQFTPSNQTESQQRKHVISRFSSNRECNVRGTREKELKVVASTHPLSLSREQVNQHSKAEKEDRGTSGRNAKTFAMEPQ